MKRVTDSRYLWRIMVGLAADKQNNALDPEESKAVVLKAARVLFDAFNLVGGTGVWQGEKEPSLVVEVIGGWEDRGSVCVAAEAIAKRLNQAEVWVSEERIRLMRVINA